ncbi:MAG: M56 family metallopeptidase [Deltaproteobacteria bacterium]|nr:M56 family metallopeptidase [Deltaproteobacteria bacterium]
MPDIILQCMSILSMASVYTVRGAVLLFVTGVIYSLIKNSIVVLSAARNIKRLPVKDYGLGTLLIDNASVTAFTSGFLRPKIYISKGLLESLTYDEIKAVFIHEVHHKKNHDPLKFLLSSVVRDTFFYVPIVKYCVKVFHTIKENAADKRVVSMTGKPIELASAILKVSTANSSKFYAFASIRGVESIDARIKRLIGERDNSVELPSARNILASSIVLLFLLLVPVTVSYGFDKRCNDEMCRITHHHQSAKECNTMAAGDMDCTVHCNVK